jgi:hypothetical protein
MNMYDHARTNANESGGIDQTVSNVLARTSGLSGVLSVDRMGKEAWSYHLDGRHEHTHAHVQTVKELGTGREELEVRKFDCDCLKAAAARNAASQVPAGVTGFAVGSALGFGLVATRWRLVGSPAYRVCFIRGLFIVVSAEVLVVCDARRNRLPGFTSEKYTSSGDLRATSNRSAAISRSASNLSSSSTLATTTTTDTTPFFSRIAST